MSTPVSAPEAGPTVRSADPSRRWYVATPHRQRGVISDWEWVPFGIRHAAEAGSTKTACGRSTSQWSTFRELPFELSEVDTCPACAGRLAELA